MMDLTRMKKLTVDGVDLKTLAIHGVQVWKSGYKNWVPYSVDADGNIYNNGLGYKDGYRVRSGGAEVAEETTACTGFIPFQVGDVLRIYPPFRGLNVVNAINYADVEFKNLGQITGSGSYGICSGKKTIFWPVTDEDGVSVLHLTTELAAEVAYIRVTNQIGESSSYQPLVTTGSEMVVTVNEEIGD